MAVGKYLITTQYRRGTEERDRIIGEILDRYAPVCRLEDIMGPPPAPGEADEVEAFLQLREQWRQPARTADEKPG